MDTKDKLLYMFDKVHGLPDKQSSCYVEIYDGEDGYTPAGINLMKEGQVSWSVSKIDLLFDYLTLPPFPNQPCGIKPDA